jgi:glycosyltransferase involved in cell wall biosynthesis
LGKLPRKFGELISPDKSIGMIHLVTWLPLPYQRTLCRTLGEAYGGEFVAWFAERTHKDFPYRSEDKILCACHYLSEVGYGKFLRELHSDPQAVIILSGWSSPMTIRTLLAATLLRKPIFIWADHPHPRQRSTTQELARKNLLRLLTLKVSGFLACGNPTVEHLVSLGIERGKITNFPYWVDLPAAWSVPERCADEAAANGPLRLVAIGRLVPVKQFQVAIEAVALANKKAGMSLAELVVVGDGPERAKLEEMSQSIAGSNVKFTGWLQGEEISERVREADALVLTSKFDAFGVVVLEAMAAGRPVLASAGVVAALDRDEGTGAVLLHPIGDIECLATQILSLASDRERLRKASIAARAMAEKWPPSRAAEIIGKILAQTRQGKLLLKKNQRAEEAFSPARADQPIAKRSIATGGR